MTFNRKEIILMPQPNVSELAEKIARRICRNNGWEPDIPMLAGPLANGPKGYVALGYRREWDGKIMIPEPTPAWQIFLPDVMMMLGCLDQETDKGGD